MTVFKRIAAALGALVFYLGLAHAVNAEPLTSQQVERFIISMPDFTALGEKHNDNKHHNIDPARPLSSSLELMSHQGPTYDDVALLASRHGFSSAEQWADVGDRVMKAYINAASGTPLNEVDAAYKEGVANVNKDRNLTDVQKKAILTGMAKGHQRNMDARKTSEQDMPAVRKHIKELDKLFD